VKGKEKVVVVRLACGSEAWHFAVEKMPVTVERTEEKEA